MTAGWEQRLKQVEQGDQSGADFYRDIVTFVRDLIPHIAQGPALSAEQVAAAREGAPARKGGKKGKPTRRAGGANAAGLGACPICKQGEITENARAYGCSRYRDGCGFTIWKTIAGLTLTKPQAQQLIEQGHTAPLEGFQSKAGKPFTAALRLDAAGKVMLDFGGERNGQSPAPRTLPARADHTRADHTRAKGSRLSGGPRDRSTPRPPGHPASAISRPLCPKCGQGQIIEGRRGYGCDRYREGCDFVVWKTVGDLTLSEGQIRALIEQGRTDIDHRPHPRHAWNPAGGNPAPG